MYTIGMILKVKPDVEPKLDRYKDNGNKIKGICRETNSFYLFIDQKR